MVFDREQELLKKVSEMARKNPAFIGTLFKLTSDMWDDYTAYIEAKRANEHLRSLHGALFLIPDKVFTKSAATILIDATMFGFPNGYDSAGCDAHKDFLNKFTAAAIKEWQPDDDFMRMRGMSAYLRQLYDQNPGIKFCCGCGTYHDDSNHQCLPSPPKEQ